MPTYLLTWNPERWQWKDLDEAIKLAEAGTKYSTNWSCGNTKTIKANERVFLLKQGKDPKGFVASGRTISDSYLDKHWGDETRTANFVDVEFDTILNTELQSPLDPSQLQDGALSQMYWAIPASGTSISEEAATELETLWDKHIKNIPPLVPTSKRNPDWQRDELILALDLYFQADGRFPSNTDPKILELSALLNALPIHSYRGEDSTFRNVNGVYLKLMNFRRFDPNQSGVGMSRGNRLEEELWNQYANDRDTLHQIANCIREGGRMLVAEKVEEQEEEFPEGKILYRMHRMRERNKAVIQKAKLQAKKSGRLHCQVCTFDFKSVYGELGEDFIEAHHVAPISEMPTGSITKVSDIALLCSNCHRMVHRRRPWLTMENLRSILRSA